MSQAKSMYPPLADGARSSPALKDFMRTFTPKSVVCLREGYARSTFLGDVVAGLTVGVIAVPLAMAFAINSGPGLTPQQGLYTAIIAGFVISLLGGSRVQIAGPTGAFMPILYAIVQKHGYDGLAVATLMAGAILMVMGLFKLGSMIKFIPYPVTTGFTAGIAVIIFSGQMKEFFGLKIPGKTPAEFIAQWAYYYHAAFAHGINWYSSGVALGALVLMAVLRKFV